MMREKIFSTEIPIEIFSSSPTHYAPLDFWLINIINLRKTLSIIVIVGLKMMLNFSRFNLINKRGFWICHVHLPTVERMDV